MVRDPARIDRILELFGSLWKYNHDARMGQMFAWITADIDPTGKRNVWNLEDNDLEQWLRDNHPKGFDNGIYTTNRVPPV